jgi:hypothetical protein
VSDLASSLGSAPPNTAAGRVERFADALNHLVRPLWSFYCIFFMVVTLLCPSLTSESAKAMSAVPLPVWGIIGGIVTFWFGGKALVDYKAASAALQQQPGAPPPQGGA